MATTDTKTAAGRYAQLCTYREPYLIRARAAAVLTIPGLMPPQGSNGSTILPTPFQSLGARGLNNLASKLLLTLLPDEPFFRMVVDDFTVDKVAQQPGMRAQVEQALNKIERAVMSDIEVSALRVPVFEAFKHLINDGNVLCYLLPTGGMRVFHLNRYVVCRNPRGEVIEIITEEDVSPLNAAPILRSIGETDEPTGIENAEQAANHDKNYKLYTRVYRNGNHFRVYQEMRGKVVPNTEGSYPLDRSPWMPLRWSKIDNEDYGRGLIEEYIGDLRSLEALAQAIVEGSAASAKMLFLVNPNGTTRIKDVAEAPNGAVRAGNAQDVTVLQVEKFADFQIALKTIEEITSRLSYAFMLNTAVQRNGERVTAEEIRYVAGEIEDSFGGVYSILAQEFQYVLVTNVLARMEKQKRLPPLPKDLMRPTITTGLTALGRGHDLNRLSAFLQALQPLGPEAIAQAMNVGDYITRVGTALGIDMDGLVKSAAEQQQASQQQQMQQLVEKLGPNVVNAISQHAQQANAPKAPAATH